MKKIFAILAIVFWTGLATSARADDSAAADASADEMFKKLDVNKDGTLTAAEIPVEHRKFFERLLRIGDANKDGSLSREEFNAAMGKKEAPVTDINKTPGVDAGSGGVKGKFDPKQIFERLDKNKDGKLTREEVGERPRLKGLFDRLGKEEITLEDLKGLQGGAKKGGKKAKKVAAKAAAKEKMAEAATESKSLPEFAKLLDTDHDGRLSREELSKAAELFDRLDKNKDGFLDAKEMAAMPAVTSTDEPPTATPDATPKRMRKRLGRPGAGPERSVQQVIQRADKDGDGQISLDEAPPALKKQFTKIDTNGDGQLDKSELQAWFQKHRRMAPVTPDGDNPATTQKASGL